MKTEMQIEIERHGSTVAEHADGRELIEALTQYYSWLNEENKAEAWCQRGDEVGELADRLVVRYVWSLDDDVTEPLAIEILAEQMAWDCNDVDDKLEWLAATVDQIYTRARAIWDEQMKKNR